MTSVTGTELHYRQISGPPPPIDIGAARWRTDLSAPARYRGRAVAEIGPFELDPATRRTLDNSVATGGTRFPVTYHPPGAEARQNYIVHVSQDEIKVVQPGMVERFNKEDVTSYDGEWPIVIIHPLDTHKLRIVKRGGEELYFSALSRQSRDLIMVGLYEFPGPVGGGGGSARLSLLGDVGGGDGGGGWRGVVEEEMGVDAGVLDVCLYTDRLRSELVRQLDVREAMERRYGRLANEKLSLDHQLQDTIASFTGVIQQLNLDMGYTGAGGGAHQVAVCCFFPRSTTMCNSITMWSSLRQGGPCYCTETVLTETAVETVLTASARFSVETYLP